jgi:hypothetical protein
MVYDSRRYIAQPLSASQQAIPKLGIFIPEFAARARSKIGAKTPILSKHFFSKSHVCAIWSFFEFPRNIAEIKMRA